MARSSDFCFKTTYVCFVLTIDCTLLSVFCSWFVNLWKVVSHEPPYPLEIAAFEPPLPLGISNDLPWREGGYGYFLEPHIITESMLTGKCHTPSQSLNPLGPKSDQHQFSPDNIRPWLFKRWITLSIE